jgi:phage-related protein
MWSCRRRLYNEADVAVSFVGEIPFWIANSPTTSTVSLSTSPQSFSITTSGDAPAPFKVTFTPNSGTNAGSFYLYTFVHSQFIQYTAVVSDTNNLVIDTGEMTVTNSGSDDLKNISGDFYKLQVGANSMMYKGSPGSVEISWQDRWY